MNETKNIDLESISEDINEAASAFHDAQRSMEEAERRLETVLDKLADIRSGRGLAQYIGVGLDSGQLTVEQAVEYCLQYYRAPESAKKIAFDSEAISRPEIFNKWTQRPR